MGMGAPWQHLRQWRLANLVFCIEDISKIEEKFGRPAIEGHRTRSDASDLKWKQIGVNEISDSWFKAEILNALGETTIEWADISVNDGENGIVAVHLTTPAGLVVLD
jgi:hypothetical protein